jgi:hypothetical protein
MSGGGGRGRGFYYARNIEHNKIFFLPDMGLEPTTDLKGQRSTD